MRNKLTDGQVQQIRDSSEPGSVIAERYGISVNYVYVLRRGEYRAILNLAA